MHVLHVVGARPNFMKCAAVMHALGGYGCVRQTLIHTGQHYDPNMSDIFLQELGIPEPDVNLQVGSGTHAQQTAAIINRFEHVVLQHNPDMVLVYGDVNSTMAVALVCSKLLVPLAHVEAGLRSFDRTMPEEINRIVTDHLCDLLLTPSSDANENLLREGIGEDRICLVGNVMIDTLMRLLPKARTMLSRDLPPRFALVTMHRPSNVDDPAFLRELLVTLHDLGRELPFFFPMHPRTRRRVADLGFHSLLNGNLRLMEPMSYLHFLALQANATLVITDSGGIQEETTFLGVPCLTVRENTERPVTITLGTNVLVGRNMKRLREQVERILNNSNKHAQVPPLWDGHAAERIADVVVNRRPAL